MRTYLDVCKKDSDGKLLMVTEGCNNNQPGMSAEGLRFADVPAVNISLESHLPVNSNISFELSALNHLMELAISQHDHRIWAQFYSDDAVVFPQYEATVQSRKELDAYYEKHTRERPIF